MQQQLCLPGMVERLFEGDAEKAERLRACFAPMYPADEVVREKDVTRLAELVNSV